MAQIKNASEMYSYFEFLTQNLKDEIKVNPNSIRWGQRISIRKKVDENGEEIFTINKKKLERALLKLKNI